MEAITKLSQWANAHISYGFDLLRVLLGSFLVSKGIDFMTQTELIMDVLNPIGTFGLTMILVYYVAIIHLFGGLLIVIGLMTRASIIFQLPILLSAVLLNFIGEMVVTNLLQAFVALALSVIFLLYGSGKRSLDHQLKLEF